MSASSLIDSLQQPFQAVDRPTAASSWLRLRFNLFSKRTCGELATEPTSETDARARAASVQKCLLFDRHTATHVDCPLEMRDAERHFGAFRRWEGAAWAPQFPRLSGTPNAETARPRMNCSAPCTRNCTGWRNGNWHDGDLRQA
jgi:hypothetical protein